MSERVEYVVIDRHGMDMPCRQGDTAIGWAVRWDDDYPEDAPHRVIKRTHTYTDEQVYP